MSDEPETAHFDGNARSLEPDTPAFEARAPYAIGMIELDENVRMLATVRDSSQHEFCNTIEGKAVVGLQADVAF